jgi:hypothetical protein
MLSTLLPATSFGQAAADEEVSIRERAQTLMQTDRDFLERVEAADSSEPPLLDTPAAPQPVAPLTAPTTSAPPQKPKAAPAVREPAEAEVQPQVRTEKRVRETVRTEVRETEVAAQPARRSEPARRPANTEAEERRVGPGDAFSERDARDFIESYLAAAERPSPEGEVAFYASSVDYFDSGPVARDFVQQDQRRYYKRWPNRRFELIGEPKVTRASNSGASVRFQVRYELQGREGKSSGQIENFLRLRRTEEGLKIAAIRERKIK